jgi:copper(I)-binding protein
MSLKTTLLAGAFALLPALASAQMMVDDPYARSAGQAAISGAAFMAIMNPTDTDDTLISATSDVAERVELHTHIQTDEGVMRMVELEEGIPLPAGETVLLQRGGLHVMFLGLTRTLNQGDEVVVTLEFEHADPLTVTVPVDLERQPMHGGMGHGNMGQGNGQMGQGTDG